MHHRRAAFLAVIAAQWLAVIGSALIARGLLLGAALEHLAAGGASLVLAMVTGALALNLVGMLRQ